MDLRSFFATFIAGVFVVIVAFYLATRGPLSAHDGWNAEGLVTVLLTATTVVLAALGIAVALVAIWGFDKIKEAAADIAKEHARTTAVFEARAVAKEVAELIAAREAQAYLQREGYVTPSESDEISKAFPRTE